MDFLRHFAIILTVELLLIVVVFWRFFNKIKEVDLEDLMY